MLFGLFTRKDINQGVEEWNHTEGAVLLDVRTKGEYSDSHIKGSINIPLDELETIRRIIPDPDAPIFVYCLSGGRSASAAAYLKRAGYRSVHDIGGIHAYRGETEACHI